MKKKDQDKWMKDEAFDTKELLKGVTLPASGEGYDLEEILAEYGAKKTAPPPDMEQPWINEGIPPEPVTEHHRKAEKAGSEYTAADESAHSAKKQAETPTEKAHVVPPSKAEKAVAADAEKAKKSDTEATAKTEKPVQEKASAAKEKANAAPEQGERLEDVMASVVDAVMEEEEIRRQEAQPVVRGGLFAALRRRHEDTEPVYVAPREENPEQEKENAPYDYEEPDEEEDDTPERDPEEATADYHRRYKRLRRVSRPALALALVGCIPAVPTLGDAIITLLTKQALTAVCAALLAAICLLCGSVFVRAVKELAHRRCTAEALAALSAIAALADCLSMFLLPGRCAALPFTPVAGLALYFTMRGEMLRVRGLRDSCHMVRYGNQPYIVTEVEGGFRKQACPADGFIRRTERESDQRGWYDLLLPVLITAATVFALLSAFNGAGLQNFFWCWSGLLAAACAFSLTAAFGAPLARLARRLQQDGCAVAGYSGAEMMCRKGSMILTDTDLFPRGTVVFNGIKLCGEEMGKAVSYAGSMIRASGSGLSAVFDELMRSQGGREMPLEEFSFYQEGGLSATISGESVILGRADFMAQMGVRLPREIKQGTGVFLAVDKQLAAIFVIKYIPSDNVDAALHSVVHNHLKPVFAVRDFNITPALLRRKFKINYKKRARYPDLSDRLALSEAEYESDGRPGALLFREGLMPYAGTVIGGKRMHNAVCRNCALALLAGICGTLLAFYLTFVGGFDVLTATSLLAYQLLWAIPPALIDGWVTQY